MTMSDRVVVMNDGRIEQVATPAEIYRRPATVFVADFIGRANFLEVDVHAVTDSGAEIGVLGQAAGLFGSHPAVAAGDAVTLWSAPSRCASPRRDEPVEVGMGGSVGRVAVVDVLRRVDRVRDRDRGGQPRRRRRRPARPRDVFEPGDFLDVGFEEGRAWLMPVDREPWRVSPTRAELPNRCTCGRSRARSLAAARHTCSRPSGHRCRSSTRAGPHDLVTEHDLASEEIIRNGLLGAVPDSDVVG